MVQGTKFPPIPQGKGAKKNNAYNYIAAYHILHKRLIAVNPIKNSLTLFL
jgi:hypothetical protein